MTATRVPQKNHLLVLGAGQELADLGRGPRMHCLTTAKQNGGISFLAHPHDPAAPAFQEPDISWEIGPCPNSTGLELWNGFSELKAHIPTRLHGIFYAFFPALMAHGPLPADPAAVGSPAGGAAHLSPSAARMRTPCTCVWVPSAGLFSPTNIISGPSTRTCCSDDPLDGRCRARRRSDPCLHWRPATVSSATTCPAPPADSGSLRTGRGARPRWAGTCHVHGWRLACKFGPQRSASSGY